jgi:hypothetical protein
MSTTHIGYINRNGQQNLGLIFYIASVLLCGCSSSRVFQTSGSTAPVGSISDVRVGLQPGKLNAEVEASYNANSMSGAIRQALLDELRSKGKFSESGAIIEFSVTDFRLRSGVDTFWFGVMAGSDYLAGTVTVKNGETVLKTFDASAKGSESAWSGMATGRVKASSRADLFCRLIARKIVAQL